MARISALLDFAFVRVPVSAPRLSAWPVFKSRLVVAVGPYMRNRPRSGLRAFSRSPFILAARSASTSLCDHVFRICHAAGFIPRVVQEVGELFTTLNFVRADAAVSLAPYSFKVMKVPRVRCVETGLPSAVWSIGVASGRSSGPDPVLGNFLSVLRENFRT